MAPEQILAALQKLDVNNDAHWTQDGLPRLETVRLFAGDQTLNRDSITAADSNFTRLAAYNAAQAAQGAAAPAAAAPTETQPGAQDNPPAAPPLADPVPPAATVAEAPVATPEFDAPKEQVDFADLTKQEQLDVINEELADMDKYLAAAKKHQAKLQLQRDDLIIAIDKETPRHSNQHDIMAYLASQNKQLQARAQQMANVKKVESELGARLSDLVPKRAPIDVSMQRRTGYGRKRPGT
jgi:hypothetical protein